MPSYSISALLFGALLLGICLIDVVLSVASTTGGGPVSTRLADAAWRSALAFHRRGSAHGMLRYLAPALLMSTVVLWAFMLWAGWALFFTVEDGAVLDSTSRAPATFVDRIYFAGFCLATLGTGDFVAGSSGWRLASVTCALSGFAALTLTMTYALSVISAATAKRQLALLIRCLGGSSTEILKNSWNGEDLSNLDDPLAQITPLILLHGERHLAYPIIHFFHASETEAALPLAIASLDEALTVATHGVADKAKPNAVVLAAARHAIAVFLRRAESVQSRSPASEPPPPDLAVLRERGLPLADPAAMASAFQSQKKRRVQLARLVEGDGWTWCDVTG